MKKYRYFYHYYRQKDAMSVHFKGACILVDDVKCEVDCETKRNKRQPRLVMRGWATEVTIKNNKAYIR